MSDSASSEPEENPASAPEPRDPAPPPPGSPPGWTPSAPPPAGWSARPGQPVRADGSGPSPRRPGGPTHHASPPQSGPTEPYPGPPPSGPPAGDQDAPWASLPPSPPAARRQHQAETSEPVVELDFDEPRGRRWPIVVVAAVAVVLLGGGGYLGWRAWFADDAVAPPPDRRSSNQAADAEAPTGSVAAVQEALESASMDCYATLTEPLPVSSCYGIVDNASAMAVRIQHESDGLVNALRIHGTVSQRDRDASVTTFTEMAEAVAGALLDEAGDGVPSISDGREELTLPWGTIRTNVAETEATAAFIRDGVEPRSVPAVPLEPGVEALRDHFTDAGFSCGGGGCERVTGKGAKAVTTTVDLSATHVRVSVALGEDARPLPKKETANLLRDVIALVVAEREEDALAWFDDHRESQLQRADLAGVHIYLHWGDGTEPALTLSSARAW